MVLERVTDSYQPLLRHLQEVFAFLALTQVQFLSVGYFTISHLHTKHRHDSLHQSFTLFKVWLKHVWLKSRVVKSRVKSRVVKTTRDFQRVRRKSSSVNSFP